MKLKFAATVALLLSLLISARAEAPLRVLLRCGPKTHGPGQHDGPQFLKDWTTLLGERGCKVDGTIGFPSGAQVENADVIVMYAAEGGTVKADDRANLDKFLKRGGGLVVLHDSVCGTDPQWWKTVIGGAWEHGHSKWFEGDVSFYYVNQEHPITAGCSNFDFDDEVYWDLHMMPEAKVLAASWAPDKKNTRNGRLFPHIYDIIPQVWTYEKDNYRAFVSIPGHNTKSFSLPHFRALLLRGIAWAGKRQNVNELCSKEELAILRYPEGGPTAPEKAAAKLELHPDFNINLVAAEPLINKPIALDWDAAGRLWVAETPEYPNGRRGMKPDQAGAEWKDHGGLVPIPGNQDRPARDRISILIDTDGDGRADRKEIFYEGLELVTGFVFFRDGVIASAAPDIWLLRDTDGDGKADKVEKLYTGLGTFDTHSVINNLRWGFDGWIYATHGYSASDHVRSGDGSKDFGRIGSGVVRFKPDGTAFEQYSSKGGNTWGLDFAWDDELFFTQPTSGDLLNHVVMSESALARGKAGNTPSYKPAIRNRKSNPLIKSENLAYVQIDLVGFFTASAGCAIYDGGTWPQEWRYNYFTTEPTINLIHHEVVTPDGVTYVANKTRDAEFIGGRDFWFRPIETRIGADGALYILDFYNQAVIHNDTRGPKHNAVNAAVRPDRDHYFGRIWRVDHKEARKLETPHLDEATTEALVKTLEHPNRWFRMTAQRLLVERASGGSLREVAEKSVQRTLKKTPTAVKNLALQTADRMLSGQAKRNLAGSLEKLITSAPSAEARIHALWTLETIGRLEQPVLLAALRDKNSAVRKNASRAASAGIGPLQGTPELEQALVDQLRDSDPRARLEAIVALGAFPVVGKTTAAAIVALFPDLKDGWLESAAFGVASKAPVLFSDLALRSRDPDACRSLIAFLGTQIGARKDASLAANFVELAAAAPVSEATRIGLENLTKALPQDIMPPWSSSLEQSFEGLAASTNGGVAAATLPLIARWDKNRTMSAKVSTLIEKQIKILNDTSAPDEQRAALATSLIAVRQLNPAILPAIGKMFGSQNSISLQRKGIEALGGVPDAGSSAILVSAYPALGPELQEAALNQLLKRSESSLAVVEALKSGKISLITLGPSAVHRLRTHTDKAVADRASAVIDELRGPEAKEKNELLAKYTPAVLQPGNIDNGKKLFTQNCAVCHKFNGEGNDLAPDLTGMGVHGPAELLVHVLDPNRVVEPNYVAYSVETKDEQIFQGIIARESPSSVVLRNAAGETEIKKDNILRRQNTGRSLMPEGFEALGGEALRDILACVGAGDSRYRIIDLSPAFTASSTRGLYSSAEATNETLRFTKFGLVRNGEVPFDIVSPSRSTNGNNVVVLRGGQGFAKTLPQRVTVKNIGLKARQLHFLGGVGGWAWPGQEKDLPVAKVSVHYANGQSDEMILKNGVEIADYNGTQEVPGSTPAPDLVSRGQVRSFSKPARSGEAIESITLESFDNGVAPTFVAITAETDAPGPRSETAGAATGAKTEDSSSKPSTAFRWGDGVKTLIVGGGSSHDFNRWFNQADIATLSTPGGATIHYTEDTGAIADALKQIDVLYLSNNKPIPDAATRKAVFDFANSGKGLLLVHPALWYNWNDWPEYNRDLVGGGARSHDKYGEFEVSIDDAAHPVTRDLPATFRISDELYHFEADERGAPIQILATGKNLATGKSYPVIWITKHPKARIICITLGHDGKAHEHPAYKKLLENSQRWVSGKQK